MLAVVSRHLKTSNMPGRQRNGNYAAEVAVHFGQSHAAKEARGTRPDRSSDTIVIYSNTIPLHLTSPCYVDDFI